MAGIKIPLTDILTKLQTLTVRKGDGQTDRPHVRVWNNQIAYEKDGKLSAYPKPALFVEIVNNPTYDIIGQQFRSVDISFRIHIVHEFMDATDGTFEQDLVVFDLRDHVVANLTAFKPTACGPLESMTEGMDYEHDNLYHYIVEFVCNFTDSIGSKYDPNHPEAYIDSPTDLDLELNPVTIQKNGSGISKHFQIPAGGL